MKARRDYRRDDQQVLGAYCSSCGDVAAETEAEIARRAHCSRAIAFRVYALRRGGTARLLGLWLEGRLSLRQAERIILSFPFDEPEQVNEAAHSSAEVARLLASERRAG